MVIPADGMRKIFLTFNSCYLNETHPNLPSRGPLTPVFLYEIPADFVLFREKKNNNNKPNRRLNSPLSLPVFGWVAYRSSLQNKIARKSPTIIPTKISRSFMNESHHISVLVRRKKVYFFMMADLVLPWKWRLMSYRLKFYYETHPLKKAQTFLNISRYRLNNYSFLLVLKLE